MPTTNVIVAAGQDLDLRGEQIGLSVAACAALGLPALGTPQVLIGTPPDVAVFTVAERPHLPGQQVATVGALAGARLLSPPAPGTILPAGDNLFSASDFTEYSALRLNATVAVLAPHGGYIEAPTEVQAQRLAAADCLRVSLWSCRGGGGRTQRWHITSNDIHPHSFPRLRPLIERPHEYAVAFHGFSSVPQGYDVIVGGLVDLGLKQAVRRALARRLPAYHIHVATDKKEPFAGMAQQNVVNRVAKRGGLQIEQSKRLRDDGMGDHVADAVIEQLVRVQPDFSHVPWSKWLRCLLGRYAPPWWR